MYLKHTESQSSLACNQNIKEDIPTVWRFSFALKRNETKRHPSRKHPRNAVELYTVRVPMWGIYSLTLIISCSSVLSSSDSSSMMTVSFASLMVVLKNFGSSLADLHNARGFESKILCTVLTFGMANTPLVTSRPVLFDVKKLLILIDFYYFYYIYFGFFILLFDFFIILVFC